jgi:hypothetical protein
MLYGTSQAYQLSIKLLVLQGSNLQTGTAALVLMLRDESAKSFFSKNGENR